MTGLTLSGAGVLAAVGLHGPVVPAGTAAGVLLGAVAVGQLGVRLRRALG
jgi:hypothetical protein